MFYVQTGLTDSHLNIKISFRRLGSNFWKTFACISREGRMEKLSIIEADEILFDEEEEDDTWYGANYFVSFDFIFNLLRI